MVKKHFKVILLTGCLLIAGVTGLWSGKEKNYQKEIAEKVIRFHVLANSNSDEDQQLKLEVKDEMAGYMAGLLENSDSAEETKEILNDNLWAIQEEAGQIIRQKGYSYPVAVELKKTWFPVKQYGDCTFPAGDYEALRILIGDAGGKNWWCVLYPNLCYIDGTCAIAGEAQKEALKEVLTEDEYASVAEAPKSSLRPKLKIVEIFQKLKGEG